MSDNKEMQYIRVLPRDLFNESKLLKCIGRLCLLIHDRQTPFEMSFTHRGGAFKIALFEDGSLSISNLKIMIERKAYRFKTTYNSKSNYPLYLEFENCDYLVFDNEGNFTLEFTSFLLPCMGDFNQHGDTI